MIQKFIEIKTQFTALHCWPECKIDKVLYLKNLHRHLIHIIVEISVTKDRQIEFFCLKDDVDNIINNLYGNENTKNLGRKSMEEISEDILKNLRKKYGKRFYSVSASEDNEVRGIVIQDDK